MKPLRVAIISGDTGGTCYYRAALLKRAFDRDPSLGVEAIFADRWQAAFEYVDLVYLLHPWEPKTIAIERLHALKRAGKAIVVDADDDVFNVPPESAAYAACQEYAFRRFQAALYRSADLVTASTEHIGRSFAARAGAPYRVVPNAFDAEVKIARPHGKLTGRPTIGWAGGVQHHGDLAALDALWPALLARGYGLLFLGASPKSVQGRSWHRTGDRVAVLEGTPSVEQYMQLLPTLGVDVALAPLVDNAFNRCRSELKAVEASWLFGAPLVMSDGPAFHAIPEGPRAQKVVGFDAAAWLDAIERGIAIARTEGRRYALPERNRLTATAPLWAAAFKEAHEIAAGAAQPVLAAG